MIPVAFVPLAVLFLLFLLVPNRKVRYYLDTDLGPQSNTEEWSVISGWTYKLEYAIAVVAMFLATVYLPIWDHPGLNKWNLFLGAFIVVSMHHVWTCVKIK
jgi:hypothetical protein